MKEFFEVSKDGKVFTKLEIQSVDTKQIKEFGTESYWNDSKSIPDIFFWREGNFGCDCNRGTWFGDTNVSCGSNKYLIRITNIKDGNILYSEFEEDKNMAVDYSKLLGYSILVWDYRVTYDSWNDWDIRNNLYYLNEKYKGILSELHLNWETMTFSRAGNDITFGEFLSGSF